MCSSFMAASHWGLDKAALAEVAQGEQVEFGVDDCRFWNVSTLDVC